VRQLCVSVSVCVCVRACVRACVHARVCVYNRIPNRVYDWVCIWFTTLYIYYYCDYYCIWSGPCTIEFMSDRKILSDHNHAIPVNVRNRTSIANFEKTFYGFRNLVEFRSAQRTILCGSMRLFLIIKVSRL